MFETLFKYNTIIRGGARNFSTGELTLAMRGLKHHLQDTIVANKLQKKEFSLSDGGLACSNWELLPPSPPLSPLLTIIM